MTRVQIAIYVVLAAALAVSVVTDLRTRKILNKITFPTMGLCLLLRLAGGLENGLWWGPATGPGLASGLLGLLIGGSFFLLLSLLGGMGLGDVKLMAAVGAGVGFPMVLACLVFVGVAGGVQALLSLVWRGKLLKTLGGMGRSALQKVRLVAKDAGQPERDYIPYGVSIAVGTVWGVWWTMNLSTGLAWP